MNPFLKMALDLGPLLIFFFGNAYFGIFAATGMFMVAIVISLSVSYAIEKKLSPMPIVTGVVVMVFGGLTLWLNDELFIKLKPTIVNTIFATVLLGGLATGRLFAKMLFDRAFHLSDDAWRTFTVRWALFFIFLALLNEVVWRNSTTDFWVAFKVWGVFPLTLLFAISQTPFLLKHQIKQGEDENPKTA